MPRVMLTAAKKEAWAVARWIWIDGSLHTATKTKTQSRISQKLIILANFIPHQIQRPFIFSARPTPPSLHSAGTWPRRLSSLPFPICLSANSLQRFLSCPLGTLNGLCPDGVRPGNRAVNKTLDTIWVWGQLTRGSRSYPSCTRTCTHTSKNAQLPPIHTSPHIP